MYALGQLGVGCGLVPGAIYDNYGPRLTAAYALLFTTIGNLGLQTMLHVDDCGGALLGFLYMLLQNGSAALYQVGLFSCIRSATPASQGTVGGIVAAGYGLSAAFWLTNLISCFLFTMFFWGDAPSPCTLQPPPAINHLPLPI